MANDDQTNLAVNSATNQILSEPYIIAFDSENGMRKEAWLSSSFETAKRQNLPQLSERNGDESKRMVEYSYCAYRNNKRIIEFLPTNLKTKIQVVCSF
ncbi:hypothetical protein TNCT_378781 [Trichonephila clavata]|uniref:Uncharacterized protein n=1 Tax=Trichonephila clavata TaxID=2740835 RepID=A0A8X6LXI2_TRICU|nr:hypothetical protein TNCT_378781 [Trichonephila clavata]